MGNPVGIPISAELRLDLHGGARAVVVRRAWRWTRTARRSRINSPATVQMIEWYKKMFRDCMEPEVLSWDDASNNESIQQGKAGWIHNPVSAYIVAQQQQAARPPTASTTTGAWRGPNGQRHETDAPRHIGIWKFSKNIEPAKEWIRYLLGKREDYDEYIMSGDAFNLPVYEKLQDHPVLRTDPEVRRAQAAKACSTTPTAGRRPPQRQGAAHHQLVSSCPT